MLEGTLKEVPSKVIPGTELMLKLRDQNLRVRVEGVFPSDDELEATTDMEQKSVTPENLEATQKYNNVPVHVSAARDSAESGSGHTAPQIIATLLVVATLSSFVLLVYRQRRPVFGENDDISPTSETEEDCRRLVLHDLQSEHRPTRIMPREQEHSWTSIGQHSYQAILAELPDAPQTSILNGCLMDGSAQCCTEEEIRRHRAADLTATYSCFHQDPATTYSLLSQETEETDDIARQWV